MKVALRLILLHYHASGSRHYKIGSCRAHIRWPGTDRIMCNKHESDRDWSAWVSPIHPSALDGWELCANCRKIARGVYKNLDKLEEGDSLRDMMIVATRKELEQGAR